VRLCCCGQAAVTGSRRRKGDERQHRQVCENGHQSFFAVV
jgi:hypothetical protein